MCSLAYSVDYDTKDYSAGALIDGTYEGKHSFVRVAVAVKNGKINNIRLLRHGGGGKKYANMIMPLIGKIIKKQSTDIDAVTGATMSSRNLQKAVDNALKKAHTR